MWVSPMIKTAYGKGKMGGLEETDLFDMPTGYEAQDVGAGAMALWAKQLELPKEERRFGKGALWPLVAGQVKTATVLQFFNACSQLVGPQLMKALLTFCFTSYMCQAGGPEGIKPVVIELTAAGSNVTDVLLAGGAAGGCSVGSYMSLQGECDTCPNEWFDGWSVLNSCSPTSSVQLKRPPIGRSLSGGAHGVRWIVLLFGLNTLLGGFFKSHSMMEMLNAGVQVPNSTTIRPYIIKARHTLCAGPLSPSLSLVAPMQVKTATTTLIFDKSLRMSAKGRAGTDQGTAVNILAVSAEPNWLQQLLGIAIRSNLFSTAKQSHTR